MAFPSIDPTELAWVTTDEMVEIDRIMIEGYGITLLQMMENAGRSLADLTISLFVPTTVTVLAGSGGNGGGGLAAARHLHNRGVEVTVSLSSAQLGPAASHQATILEAMGIHFTGTPNWEADVIIDAMVGYNLTGPLRGRANEWAAVLDGTVPTVSLDVPSGLDAAGHTTGQSVRATATMTLCLPKVGLRDNSSVGNLYVADITVPASVVARVTDAPPPPFHSGRILYMRSPS